MPAYALACVHVHRRVHYCVLVCARVHQHVCVCSTGTSVCWCVLASLLGVPVIRALYQHQLVCVLVCSHVY